MNKSVIQQGNTKKHDCLIMHMHRKQIQMMDNKVCVSFYCKILIVIEQIEGRQPVHINIVNTSINQLKSVQLFEQP
jgi:hypothetical protein